MKTFGRNRAESGGNKRAPRSGTKNPSLYLDPRRATGVGGKENQGIEQNRVGGVRGLREFRKAGKAATIKGYNAFERQTGVEVGKEN